MGVLMRAGESTLQALPLSLFSYIKFAVDFILSVISIGLNLTYFNKFILKKKQPVFLTELSHRISLYVESV